MGVLEVVVVLEAVSQKSVQSDVGEPDEAEGENEILVPPPPDSDQEGRQRCAVRQVVHDRPETSATEVTGHDDVWEKNGQWNQPPRLMSRRVGHETADQKGGPFEPKPPTWRSDDSPIDVIANTGGAIGGHIQL
jgi:hypothetical protein